MRISIKTKKRRLVIATGSDTDALEPATQSEWIQMSGADLTVAPDPEAEYYEDEEGEEWVPSELKTTLGFAPRTSPNIERLG
jgi:hypothetical protein